MLENELFICWLPVALSPLSVFASHRCMCLSAQPLPHSRPWLDSSIPSRPGNQPSLLPAAEKSCTEKKGTKKACNIFPRPADFPGCQSSAASAVRKRRRGGWNAGSQGCHSAAFDGHQRGGITRPQSRGCLMKLRASTQFYPVLSPLLVFMIPILPAPRLGVITIRASF